MSNTSTTNKRQRSVRFAEQESDEVTIEILGPLLEPSSELSDEIKSEIWWSKEELDNFCTNGQHLAREIARRESSNRNDSKSYSKVLLNGYYACESEAGATDTQLHYIRQWTKAAFSRRGIERAVIKELDWLRQDRRIKSKSAVFDAQDCSTNMKNKSDRAEFIKSAYQCRTVGARNFAHMLAVGDAYAARVGSMLKRTTSSSTFSTSSNESTDPFKKERRSKQPTSNKRRSMVIKIMEKVTRGRGRTQPAC